MDRRVKAALDEARKRLWKLAEDPRVAEADRNLASVVGDLLEDVVHCGFTVSRLEPEDGSSHYVVNQPAEMPSAAGGSGK